MNELDQKLYNKKLRKTRKFLKTAKTIINDDFSVVYEELGANVKVKMIVKNHHFLEKLNEFLTSN